LIAPEYANSKEISCYATNFNEFLE
jgi:hypothetical protein